MRRRLLAAWKSILRHNPGRVSAEFMDYDAFAEYLTTDLGYDNTNIALIDESGIWERGNITVDGKTRNTE